MVQIKKTIEKVSKCELNNEKSFRVQRFVSDIKRERLLMELMQIWGSASVIAIEGISGIGKTHFISNFIVSNEDIFPYDSVIWHDTLPKETLDEFFLRIDQKVSLNLDNKSSPAKCGEFIDYLVDTKKILVIDDYHQVDLSLYSDLIDHALKYNGTQLVLISNTYIDYSTEPDKIKHFNVTGLGFDETKLLLEAGGVVNIDSEIIDNLIIKTDGLPLAIPTFCTLLTQFGRNPADLLRGSMVTAIRLKKWFKDVTTLIDDTEFDLLKMLSICEGPFNINIVRMFCKDILNIDESTFEILQRAFLIQKHSPYRWSVHNLISDFCKSCMSESEITNIHLHLAKYYEGRVRYKRKKVLTDIDFDWMVKACKEFQKANRYCESERILNEIKISAKSKGNYELYSQLSMNELKANSLRDTWIDYDNAHCCMIVGKLKQAYNVMNKFKNYFDKVEDLNKKFSFIRLYAEILYQMRETKAAFELISANTDEESLKLVKPIIFRQFIQFKVVLLTELDIFDRAFELCELLINESSCNKFSRAVAITTKAIILNKQGLYQESVVLLNEAVTVFRKCQDKRGESWALRHLSLSEISLGRINESLANIKKSIKISSENSECSVDYQEFLKQIKNSSLRPKPSKLINSEIQRINKTLVKYV